MNLKADPHTRFTLNTPPLASGECGPFLFFYPLIHLVLFSITISFLSLTPSFASSPLSLTFYSSPYPPVAMHCFPPPHARFLEPLEEFPLVIPFPDAHLLSRYLPCPPTPLRGRSLTLTQASLVLWASSMKHPAPSMYLFQLQVSRCLPCSLSESCLSSVP